VDAAATVAQIERTLARQGTRNRAENERRYLKSDLRFLGVTQPLLRREARAFVRAHRALARATARALVQRLWAARVHELRSFAIGVLELRSDLLTRADVTWLRALVEDANTWAHVDWLAIKVIGALVAREPALGRQLDRWARHPNFWVRRTALLALHDPLLAGAGDFEHFARLAAPMLGEQEFFIRKAIGWLLRSTAKRTPERTYRFVAQHAREMAGLTFREATRALPPAQQKRLRALREESALGAGARARRAPGR
jgi:3-methyladenine DNA glycosylase AlkD